MRRFAFLLVCIGLEIAVACRRPTDSRDRTTPGPTMVVGITGDQQQGVAGQQLTAPLVVEVRDLFNNPLPNRTVNWSVESGGGSVSPRTSTTGSDGRASARWTLGATVGEQRVAAIAAGNANDVVHFTATASAATPLELTLTPVATGLASPLWVTAPPNDARLFIVEQVGRVRVVENGQLLPTPFLDISSSISAGGERGLLSLAFHPQYAGNGFLFVDFTDVNGDTRVERYHVSANPNVADPASATPILFQTQPFANHNGGLVTFGPDGMLYVALGDGGSGGDPLGNGQSLGTLLGKLLRIDVDHGLPYSVPADNPFVGRAGARPEIWAYGLRNPWRFAFDPPANALYIADVGQNAWEEVDVVGAQQRGVNFGWNTMEGAHCYVSASCDGNGLTLPVLEYDHGQGCSITGGFVYRGSALPELAGHYLYSDYCGGWLRSFRYANGLATDRRDWAITPPGAVTSFGRDASGELYLTTAQGAVYRIARRP